MTKIEEFSENLGRKPPKMEKWNFVEIKGTALVKMYNMTLIMFLFKTAPTNGARH